MLEFARIQDTALNLEDFDGIQAFPECGGTGIFIGTVRNHHEGRTVQALKYTSYAPVAEKMIRTTEQEIQEKYALRYVRVVHRIGTLDIGDKAIIALRMLHIAEKHFRPVKKRLSVLNMKCQFGKKSFIPMEAANMLQAAIFAKTMMKSMNNTIIIKIFLLGLCKRWYVTITLTSA